MTLPHS